MFSFSSEPISALRRPHCYVITEGGRLAGPEEVIQREFTDSLTGDIKGRSFSHARPSPGSDSCTASGVRGNTSGPGGQACEHLSCSSASGTATPDTAREFTHGGTRTRHIRHTDRPPRPDAEPNTADVHIWRRSKYPQQMRAKTDTINHAITHKVAEYRRSPPETPEVTDVSKQHIGFTPYC